MERAPRRSEKGAVRILSIAHVVLGVTRIGCRRWRFLDIPQCKTMLMRIKCQFWEMDRMDRFSDFESCLTPYAYQFF